MNTVANFPAQSDHCLGTTITFPNNSLNASSYYWDFGDPSTTKDTSSLTTPTYTYTTSGTHNIMLVANPRYFCADTMFHQFIVHPIPTPSFAPQADQCFPNNSFTFNALGKALPNDTITWDFGATATPSSSSEELIQTTFSTLGSHPIKLTMKNFGCTKNYFDTVNIFPIPEANFTILKDSGCQPFSITFYDNSFSWTPLSYLWNFGDGNISILPSPSHTYQSPGIFDVTLTISTNSGCIYTDTLYLPQLITVKPKPTSKFIINPIEVYFLNHVIAVNDLSNELYQEFHFGDGTIFTDRFIEYSYLDTGHYLFKQIVINEFNCKDTSNVNIWIKPDFLFFVPNTFTPDNDALNDIFLPKIQGIIEYEILLYNRWGELFFNSRNLAHGWDGNYKNKPSPIGVYNWRIIMKTVDHQVKKRTGHVNLLR